MGSLRTPQLINMTAADYDFRSTRNEIISRAYRILGTVAQGQLPSADQLVAGIQALNEMVKSWQNRHIFLWTLKHFSQTLTADDADYEISDANGIISIQQAYLRDSDNNDKQLQIIGWNIYQDLPNKLDSGEPSHVSLDYQSSPTLYVWRVPNATVATAYTIEYLGIQRLKDWDSAAGTGDFPAKWERALVYGLAADLADDDGLPLREREYLQNKANSEFLMAKAADYEHEDCDIVEGAF